jgi:small subunit ribosomal protein S20
LYTNWHICALLYFFGEFELANSKQARKRALQNNASKLRNSMLRNRAYTYIKRARTALQKGVKEEAKLAVGVAMQAIDRMVPKGIFHRNRAGRLKSRLNARLKKLVLSN